MGRSLAAGRRRAVCTDCHGAHEILAASDPNSSILQIQRARHLREMPRPMSHQFMQSIHGQALARGNGQAPVCTDCHGIHSIKAHLDPNSSVSSQNVRADHLRALPRRRSAFAGVRRDQTIGVHLPGQLSRACFARRIPVAANCASCHGVHNILPSTDPRSTINKANLAKTCGVCHPGVKQNVHPQRSPRRFARFSGRGSTAVRWIRRFYLV